MPKNTLHRLLNALAFANVGNLGEFQRLLERLDSPQTGLPELHPVDTTPARNKACVLATDSSRHLAAH